LPTPILYVETNFLISHAAGRDGKTGEVLSRSPDRFRIVMPSGCFMEALSAFEDERKRHHRLIGDLKQQVGQSKRNVTSPGISRLIDHLERAIDELWEVFNDFQGRLYGAIDFLRTSAELIHPTPEILGESVARTLLDEPTDNLILASILSHAGSHPEEVKAFLSENRRDFDLNPYSKDAIGLAGVKYFSSPGKFLEWREALPES
jgi:hypothetical protein